VNSKQPLENDEMGFTIKQVKAKASDCQKTHRWARCEVKGELFTYRIIGVGTKYVRLMDNSGFIWTELPKNITRIW